MIQMRTLLALPAVVTAFGLHAQCSVDIAADTITLYDGYDPMACADLSAVATGTAPIAYAWSSGATTATISVCDTASSWYFVTITDADTCSATDSVFVNVVDVHCGASGNKVLVCHIPPGNPGNAHTICISENAVPAHLAHGCQLGPCSADADSLAGGDDELAIMVSPNPMSRDAFVSLRSTVEQRVTLTVVDASGRRLATLLELDATAGETYTTSVSDDVLSKSSGMVWLRLQGASGARVQRALMLER